MTKRETDMDSEVMRWLRDWHEGRRDGRSDDSTEKGGEKCTDADELPSANR